MVIRRKVFSNKFESSFEKALNEKREREAFEVGTRNSGGTPWVIAPGKELDWHEDEANRLTAEEEARKAAEAAMAKKEENMKNGTLAAAGVAALGAGGYAAYKAWKKKQAKKKAATAQAEDKFKK